MRTQDSLDDPHASAVSLLLANKKKVEAAGNRPSMEDLMSLLFSATQVRRCGVLRGWGVRDWDGRVIGWGPCKLPSRCTLVSAHDQVGWWQALAVCLAGFRPTLLPAHYPSMLPPISTCLPAGANLLCGRPVRRPAHRREGRRAGDASTLAPV